MHLSKLAIINYRSCRNLVLDFKKDVPNTYIGINDAGKTVILKSIQNLLESETLNLSHDYQLSSDLSNTQLSEKEFKSLLEDLSLPEMEYDSHSIIFIGIFETEDGDISDDFIEKASEHLQWSIESISNEEIVLLKRYSSENPQGIYYLCAEEESTPSSLWSKGKTELKSRIKELSITDDQIDNDNKSGPFRKLELFRSIYKKVKTSPQWTQYSDFVKKDKTFFPTYRYIDWNASMDDIKNLAGDAMSLSIEESKDKLQEKALEISQEANDKVNEDLSAKTKDLLRMIPQIKTLKAGISFDIKESISDIVVEKENADGEINVDSQGEGLKKQILFAFLKWRSMQEASENDSRINFIWCFDEPEVHLFPSAKRELFDIIKDLAEENFQIIMSTHSTLFIDRLSIKLVNKVDLVDGYTAISTCDSVDDIHNVLQVRNSDILFFDKFLAVEGDTDYSLIPHLYQIFFGRTLEEDSIQIVNLKGESNRKKSVKFFRQVLKDFKKTEDCVFYILDGDTKGFDEDNVSKLGICDIEDSISNEVWINLVNDFCEINVNKDDLDSLRNELDQDVHDKKFHKMLSDLVYSKQENKEEGLRIPSKGSELAEALKKYIENKKDIPGDVVKAFKKFNF
ncbi:AAA family ATPase [Candidatus Dojkabacteria bacterium]|nr:AAA family ATPase [Candidatus Dojkabacteria bacterium]